MGAATKFFLRVRPGDPVGPHPLDALREWSHKGVISAELEVCREGDEHWTPISSIPNFYDLPSRLRERLERYRTRVPEAWWADPASEKQIRKLKYFEIPFDIDGLTKGRASELIDTFAVIDPGRAQEYEDRPASGEQLKKLHSLGSHPKNITYGEARSRIEDLELRKLEQEEKKSEAEDDLDDLYFSLNDEDVRELCNYKVLTKAQVRQMLDYLNSHVPGWQQKSRFELGDLVLKLFPQRARAPKRRSGRTRHKTASSSGMFLLVVVVLLGWLLNKGCEAKQPQETPKNSRPPTEGRKNRG